MKSGLGVVIGIMVSGILGAVGGYSVAKNKYLSQADEEIKSMKELYEKKAADCEEKVKKAKQALEEMTADANLFKQAYGKVAAENYIRENGIPEGVTVKKSDKESEEKEDN